MFIYYDYRRVMIILDVTIIAPGSEVGKKLGNPQTWSEEGSAPAAAQPTVQSAPKPSFTPAPVSKPTPNLMSSNLNTSAIATKVTHPINSLSPYQNQ